MNFSELLMNPVSDYFFIRLKKYKYFHKLQHGNFSRICPRGKKEYKYTFVESIKGMYLYLEISSQTKHKYEYKHEQTL